MCIQNMCLQENFSHFKDIRLRSYNVYIYIYIYIYKYIIQIFYMISITQQMHGSPLWFNYVKYMYYNYI